MSSDWKKSRRELKLPCDVAGPDDGIDPKLLFHSSSRKKGDRGVRRLCSQVRESLTYAFAGSCRDEVLLSLYVEYVEPAPDASRLAVTVRVPDGPAGTRAAAGAQPARQASATRQNAAARPRSGAGRSDADGRTASCWPARRPSAHPATGAGDRSATTRDRGERGPVGRPPAPTARHA
jgi:ribosome-binding factor A